MSIVMWCDRAFAAGALLATAACGFLGASLWAIPAGALALAALRTDQHAMFAEKYANVGAIRIWALFFTASFANRTLWSAIAFTAGMVLVQLVR